MDAKTKLRKGLSSIGLKGLRPTSVLIPILLSFLLIMVLVPQVEASEPPSWYKITGNFMESGVYLAKRGLYAWQAISFATEGKQHLLNNLEEYVLMNPSPTHPLILGATEFFISLLQPFYVLAITLTGFYLIFSSASPSSRSKAKRTFVKLLVSMVLISLSPYIMRIFLSITENIAASVLAQASVDYYIASFDAVVWKLEVIHVMNTLLDIEMGFYSMLPLLFLVWGVQLILMIRFLAVILWTVFLPVSIFFYSIGFTQDIGRNMVEQTILWSSLQVLNAIIIAVSAIMMMSKPPGFMLLPLPFGWSIDILMFMGVIALGAAPALLLVWFRNFLP